MNTLFTLLREGVCRTGLLEQHDRHCERSAMYSLNSGTNRHFSISGCITIQLYRGTSKEWQIISLPRWACNRESTIVRCKFSDARTLQNNQTLIITYTQTYHTLSIPLVTCYTDTIINNNKYDLHYHINVFV